MNLVLPFVLLHVACAVTSPVLFTVRTWRGVRGRTPTPDGFLRIAPYVVDGVLVLAGLVLAALVDQWPFVDGWLTAKLIALIVYLGIVHGSRRAARTTFSKLAAWILGLLVIAYIFGVALTMSPTAGVFAAASGERARTINAATSTRRFRPPVMMKGAAAVT